MLSVAERFSKLLATPPDRLTEIDQILEGKSESEIPTGPLLLNMTESAKLLGCSRTCLWRILRAGKLKRIELFPGSYRLRRADVEALAAGRKEGANETPPK